MNTPRQTATYLKQRFADVGMWPTARRGQNFLIDLNLLEVLLHHADVGPNDVVLEIGTGTGSLTARLAQQAAAVVTVEVDPQLAQLASETLVDLPNITLLRQDALRNKNHIDDRVLQALQDAVQAGPNRRLKLVANLPYNIATPILSNLLTTPIVPVSMTSTIQKELAERIVAPPRTKDYSALSIWLQSLCDVELLRVLPPTVFWPRPKVESAFIQIVPNDAKRALIPDLDFYHHFVRSLFLHRRKFLRSGLLSTWKQSLGKDGVDQVMAELRLDASTRAEELDIPSIQRLCSAVRCRLP